MAADVAAGSQAPRCSTLAAALAGRWWSWSAGLALLGVDLWRIWSRWPSDLIVSTLSMHHCLPWRLRRRGRDASCPGGSVWIYDFRFMSDRELTAAAQAHPAFGGQPVHRSPVQPGLLHVYVRLTLTRPPSPDQPSRSAGG